MLMLRMLLLPLVAEQRQVPEEAGAEEGGRLLQEHIGLQAERQTRDIQTFGHLDRQAGQCANKWSVLYLHDRENFTAAKRLCTP